MIAHTHTHNSHTHNSHTYVCIYTCADITHPAQLANFLVLKETVIPGYDPPSVITELHVHVDECSLEYR